MSIAIAILVSGKGSNMQAILDAIGEGMLAATVKVVISNNAQAEALSIATRYGVTTACIPSAGISRQAHEKAVLSELAKYQFDYLVLAGYMKVLTSEFLRHFRHSDGHFNVINIHPSLLPAFPGARGYDDAFNYGVRVSGVTIHLVDEQVDHGRIIAQESFKRLPNDTLETFKARGLSLEHQLYPAVLAEIALNGLKLVDCNQSGSGTGAADVTADYGADSKSQMQMPVRSNEV